MNFDIVAAHRPADIEDVRILRREYVNWLGIDHISEEFEAELEGLPGIYSPPLGNIFLARRHDRKAIGCIGVRPFDRPGVCEVKHLYVRDEARGSGVGRALVKAAVTTAAAAGYQEALLDVLSTMTPAMSVYATSGFQPIPAYWKNPVPQALFFSKKLRED